MTSKADAIKSANEAIALQQQALSKMEQTLASIKVIEEATDAPPPPPDPLILIPSHVLEFDARDVAAGETIRIEAGRRKHLKIKNVQGDPSNRIRIVNYGGVVEFLPTEPGKTAVTLSNCSHFDMIGSGASEKYGFKIAGTLNGFGLRTLGKCTDYTLGRIEATGVTTFQTFMLNAPANCDNPRWGETWEIRNVELFELYTHDNTDEGAYIGSSHALGGKTIPCGDEDVQRIDPRIIGLTVHGCVFENSGQDGLQIMGASDVKVYNNTIRGYGLDDKASHREGLRLGKSVEGEVHDNLIEFGYGHGITVNHMVGKLHIHDNRVRYAGHIDEETRVRGSYGVHVYTPSASRWEEFIDDTEAANLLIEENKVAFSSRKPFKWGSEAGLNNKIVNNIVIEDVPEMPDDDDDMIKIESGTSPLTFEGNEHKQAES